MLKNIFVILKWEIIFRQDTVRTLTKKKLISLTAKFAITRWGLWATRCQFHTSQTPGKGRATNRVPLVARIPLVTPTGWNPDKTLALWRG